MNTNDTTTEKKYEVTDELRKKYADITLTFDTDNLIAQGYNPVFLEKLIELIPVISSTIKDMSIIEAEYIVDKTGIGSMFDGTYGMEEASRYIRHEAYKVAVEKNKEKILRKIENSWNNAAKQAASSDSPSV